MSLYNLMFGCNSQAAWALSPFLPRSAFDFPRFRDVFTDAEDLPESCKEDADRLILVYTRMGGGNRNCWESDARDCECPACEADRLEEDERCIERYDDEFDSTFCTFVFRVTDEDLPDFLAIREADPSKLSPDYYARFEVIVAAAQAAKAAAEAAKADEQS